ncbi:DinB family protein [Francisella sp. 19X1-34]|uniref:DinB family protein n=1 Tax=Francisella sp. 19X1-34 TaxID=3087177 RepID=UPI002E3453E7|nr:DinB family protein [Francisella sp. 19X1-34]MED7788412.1 DinB family protein [Francisella sp. 19X1-34]
MVENLEKIFDYKKWSENRLIEAIRKVDKSDKILLFIRQQLNHMIIVEELFSARIQGNRIPHSNTNSDTLPELTELENRLNQSSLWYIQNLKILSTEQTIKNIDFVFVDGLNGRMSILEILFHIINHGTYHRSAIGHRLEQEGYTRPADTFTMYLHHTDIARRHR